VTTPDIITAAALVIGDEILSGRTKDKNIGTIAEHLTSIGIQLREVRVVPDDEAEIVCAINALRARYTYVFSTGGIGPTHDDITADCMAKAFGVSIDVDPRAVALMKSAYQFRDLELTEARLRMARIPDGATLIANSISTAPGFMIGNVIVMAGVPAIMESMLKDATQHLRTGAKVAAETIVLSCPESEIAGLFAEHQRLFPDVTMGSYPAFNDGKYKTELVLRSCAPDRLSAALAGLRTKLETAGLLQQSTT
jgi:molybdenum cofactor synthesis domain-containing protein